MHPGRRAGNPPVEVQYQGRTNGHGSSLYVDSIATSKAMFPVRNPREDRRPWLHRLLFVAQNLHRGPDLVGDVRRALATSQPGAIVFAWLSKP